MKLPTSLCTTKYYLPLISVDFYRYQPTHIRFVGLLSKQVSTRFRLSLQRSLTQLGRRMDIEAFFGAPKILAASSRDTADTVSDRESIKHFLDLASLSDDRSIDAPLFVTIKNFTDKYGSRDCSSPLLISPKKQENFLKKLLEETDEHNPERIEDRILSPPKEASIISPEVSPRRKMASIILPTTQSANSDDFHSPALDLQEGETDDHNNLYGHDIPLRSLEEDIQKHQQRFLSSKTTDSFLSSQMSPMSKDRKRSKSAPRGLSASYPQSNTPTTTTHINYSDGDPLVPFVRSSKIEFISPSSSMTARMMLWNSLLVTPNTNFVPLKHLELFSSGEKTISKKPDNDDSSNNNNSRLYNARATKSPNRTRNQNNSLHTSSSGVNNSKATHSGFSSSSRHSTPKKTSTITTTTPVRKSTPLSRSVPSSSSSSAVVIVPPPAMNIASPASTKGRKSISSSSSSAITNNKQRTPPSVKNTVNGNSTSSSSSKNNHSNNNNSHISGSLLTPAAASLSSSSTITILAPHSSPSHGQSRSESQTTVVDLQMTNNNSIDMEKKDVSRSRSASKIPRLITNRNNDTTRREDIPTEKKNSPTRTVLHFSKNDNHSNTPSCSSSHLLRKSISSDEGGLWPASGRRQSQIQLLASGIPTPSKSKVISATKASSTNSNSSQTKAGSPLPTPVKKKSDIIQSPGSGSRPWK
jgi:hypothetical protein